MELGKECEYEFQLFVLISCVRTFSFNGEWKAENTFSSLRLSNLILISFLESIIHPFGEF